VTGGGGASPRGPASIRTPSSLCGASASPSKIGVTSSPFPARQSTLIVVGSSFTTSSGVSPPVRASVMRRRSSRVVDRCLGQRRRRHVFAEEAARAGVVALSIANQARTWPPRAVEGQAISPRGP
jgi:hypothetical protein